jgi:hypothetical protein
VNAVLQENDPYQDMAFSDAAEGVRVLIGFSRCAGLDGG